MSSSLKILPPGKHSVRHHNPATTSRRTFQFFTAPSRRGAADMYTFYDNADSTASPDNYEDRLNRAKEAYNKGDIRREEIRDIAKEMVHEYNVGRQKTRDAYIHKRSEEFLAKQKQHKVNRAEQAAKRAAKRAEQTAKRADKTRRKFESGFESGSGIKTRRKRKASRRKRRRASAKAKRKASRRKGRKAGTRSKR